MNPITINNEVTTVERGQILAAFLARKDELDYGMPLMCRLIQQKVGAAGDRVRLIDGRRINTDNITPRDLQNFKDGRKTTLDKLYVLVAYLTLIDEERPNKKAT